MFRPVKRIQRTRSPLRRCAAVAAAGGVVAVFVAGAAGAVRSSFVARAVVAAGNHVTDFAVADFNGDGTLDLVASSGSRRSNDLSVLLGDGAGGYRLGPR